MSWVVWQGEKDELKVDLAAISAVLCDEAPWRCYCKSCIRNNCENATYFGIESKKKKKKAYDPGSQKILVCNWAPGECEEGYENAGNIFI